MTEPNPWDRYAAIEPYFAVLANPKYLRTNLTRESESEFFATGEAYARHILETIRQRFARMFSPAAALEFGCGPGRVAIPLGEHATRVVAVDTSREMLALASANAQRRGRENIAFRTPSELFGGDDERFDLINASLVFQHIPPSEGLPLLAKLTERLSDSGVGVFSIPYRRTSNPVASLTRSVRRAVPAANAAVNFIRRKPAGFPFLHPYVYDLGDVLAALRAAGFADPFVVTESQGELETATLFVRRPLGALTRSAAIAPPPAAPPDFIDVKELIANTSMDELHRKAEEYFSGLRDWDHHLAKPFARAADAPPILTNLAVVIDGLRLHPGIDVLEFGGGTGWLSRILTQLSCRVTLTDVSPSALEIAKELYRRQPPIGNQPEPQFRTFDGHRIDLPDASVDRIVTFDAFHHVVNPEEVLAEFARVLRPGGIAAFAEPGPYHSRTAQSQYEMRTFGVVENDIDIHAIWESAHKAGFVELRIAAFTRLPMYFSLTEYDDLVAAGEPFVRFADAMRSALAHFRDFFLYKEGAEPCDSRRIDGLRARIEVQIDGRDARATIENTGTAEWLAGAERYGGVALGSHAFDEHGALIEFELHWELLPHAVRPGETIELRFTLPELPPRTSEIEFDMVAANVTWFALQGSPTARVAVR